MYKNKTQTKKIFKAAISIGLTSFMLFSSGVSAAAGMNSDGETSEYEVTADNTVYGIGSVSKMYTTTAVLKLAEQGLLNLDTPLIEYIPEFTMADERYKEITPRMLLNHTSGIMGTTYKNAFIFGQCDTRYHDSVLEELSSQALKADPGEYGVYCNDGFTLAELLIERVSGMSYSEYIDREILTPMGLENTFTPTYNYDTTNIAPAYDNGKVLPVLNCQLIGSGGIYSTASDVAKFGQLFTDGGGYDGILSKESIDMMAASNTANDAISCKSGNTQYEYGLGWDCVNAYPYNSYDIKALTKGGSVVTSHSALIVLPEENISAAMCISGGEGTECIYAMEDIILEILEDEGLIDKKDKVQINYSPTPEIKTLPESYRRYEGIYASSQMLKVEFDTDGTLLVNTLDAEVSNVQRYSYIGNGEFISAGGEYLGSSGQLISSAGGNKGVTKIYFSEQRGEVYLCGTTYESVYGLGESAVTSPFAQKVSDRELSASEKEAWGERLGKKYFLSSSYYSSTSFLTDGIRKIVLVPETECYIATDGGTHPSRIIDENTAFCDIDIPIMAGRDLPTYTFDKSGRMNVSGLDYIGEGELCDISELGKSVTMTENEQIKWYKISDAGKDVYSVTLPEKGAFYVYDKKGSCIAHSLTSEKTTLLLLPTAGYLALAGESGSTFTILPQADVQ